MNQNWEQPSPCDARDRKVGEDFRRGRFRISPRRGVRASAALIDEGEGPSLSRNPVDDASCPPPCRTVAPPVQLACRPRPSHHIPPSPSLRVSVSLRLTRLPAGRS